MNNLHPNTLALLQKFGLKPDKRLGQNFLVDPFALEQVIQAANIQATDRILEIGPGLGSLTCLLASQSKWVVAVELDSRLIPALEEVLKPFQNTTIIQGDILQLNLIEVMHHPGYLVVANIPYYITSALIRHILETQITPQRMVLTVQNEVAERICAIPGEMSLLALSVQVYGHPRIAAQIPASAFYPAPKVDSAVVSVELYPEPMIGLSTIKTFFLLAKAGFSQKRKTLRNSLAAGMHWSPEHARDILLKVEIDPQRRAETLSIHEWSRLADHTQGLPPNDQ